MRKITANRAETKIPLQHTGYGALQRLRSRLLGRDAEAQHYVMSDHCRTGGGGRDGD